MLAWVMILAMLADPGTASTIRLPLDDRGSIDAAALVARLADQAGLETAKPLESMRLPVRGVAGALALRRIAEILGPQVAVSLEPDALVLRLDPGTTTDLRQRARSLGTQIEHITQRMMHYGVHALSSYHPNDPQRPTVCLVHGMNSSSGSFVHMIPILERAGFGVILYDYPFNRDLDELAPAFVREVTAFRRLTGEDRPWTFLTHSMGALLARWYVERDDFPGDVDALILIAPPNAGSAAARAQALLQLIQGTGAVNGGKATALAQLGDGLGEAAGDLLPGSAFLRRLGSKRRPDGVRCYVLAGDRGFLDEGSRRAVEARLGLVIRSGGLLGGLTKLASGDVRRQLDELCDGTGDGCVSVASARLEGADELVILHANHVELIRGPLLFPEPGPVVCMPHVLRWLGRPAAP
jgi:pimeloyl-ACP methyl ester carboxylesterase